jgi:ribose transport system substrate-binding protein
LPESDQYVLKEAIMKHANTNTLRRRVLTASALASWAVAFLAGAPAWAENPVRISVVEPITTGEWADEIKAGAEAGATAAGFPVKVRVVGPSSFIPGEMIKMFQTEAQTAPDVIIVTNVVSQLMIEPGLEAESNGIKLAWINSAPTPDFANDLFVGADPRAMGRKVASVLAEALSKQQGVPAAEIQGKIVVGLCLPGLVLLEDRIAGTIAGVAELMPKVTFPPTLETKSSRDESYALWNEAIRKYPDALAYLDACEPGQVNITKLIHDDNLKATTVGYDGPEEIRQAVHNKIIPGAMTSNFFMQAYYSVLLSAQAVHDKKPTPAGWLTVPALFLDSSNIDAYIKAWAAPVTGLATFNADNFAKLDAMVKAGQLRPSSEFNKRD